MIKIAGIVITIGMVLAAQAKMVFKDYEYKIDTTTFKGFVAYNDSLKGKLPGVLVVHEWWGLNDFSKTQAKRLAQMGYVALAVDMYGNGKNTTDMSVAAKLAAGVRGTPLMRQRVAAGFAELKHFDNVDSNRMAAIGFCFGGTGVLELAYSGAKAKGVVSFHGGLFSVKPEDAPNIKAKILVLHGADDPNVKADTIAHFQDALRKAGADWQMVYFGNAVHAFTNPAAGNDKSKGMAYNPLAAQRSWKDMEIFLHDIFAENVVVPVSTQNQ